MNVNDMCAYMLSTCLVHLAATNVSHVNTWVSHVFICHSRVLTCDITACGCYNFSRESYTIRTWYFTYCFFVRAASLLEFNEED